VNLGLLKRRYVKPSQVREATANRKWGTKNPRIYKADRTNFPEKEEIKFFSEVNYTYFLKKRP
jgi:hypothetical protein